MFPHNSSSHEISTETNAFVQNSKGDVVVLEGSSLSGAREGERPEHARYCDIEFINSSMMAAPISHPKATAANDFLTVLPRQSGELSFAGVGEACQSVAKETTKNPTNHLLTYDNNKVNNHNNAEHNHHKYRKQKTPGSLFDQQLGSSAVTSKSTCKPLSDNKDSFSDVSVRVLKVSVRLVVKEEEKEEEGGGGGGKDEEVKEVKVEKEERGETRRPAGVPSLVRIPKSDRPQRQSRLANIVDNYSLLGSRLDHGENNKVKANISLVSNNYYYCNNNSKSVILLSSTSHGDNYLLAEFGLAGVDAKNPVNLVVDRYDENDASDKDDEQDQERNTRPNNDDRTRLVLRRFAADDRAIGQTIRRRLNDSTSTSFSSSFSVSLSSASSSSSSSTKSANHEHEMYKSFASATTRTATKKMTTSSSSSSSPPTSSSSSSSTSSRKMAKKEKAQTRCAPVLSLVRNNSKAQHHASSSITLIVYKNEITDHTLQSFLDNLTKKRAASRITTTNNNYLIDCVTVIELKQRICVPLLLMIEGYNDNCDNNDDFDYDFNYCYYNHRERTIDNDNGVSRKLVSRNQVNDDNAYEKRDHYYFDNVAANANDNANAIAANDNNNDDDDDDEDEHDDYGETMNISNNNQDVIGDIVNVAVCYKTSCKTTTNISLLGSQNDGIRRTEATMFTVGALSFQDNDKSNKPLNDSFKDNKYQVSTEVDLESNSAYFKSVSKSTPSVKSSDKSEMSRVKVYEEMTNYKYQDDNDKDEDKDDKDKDYKDDFDADDDAVDYEEAPIGATDEIIANNHVKSVSKIVNIPKPTTCEPTMTLNCQSATVTSQTNDVPVPRGIDNTSSHDFNATVCPDDKQSSNIIIEDSVNDLDNDHHTAAYDPQSSSSLDDQTISRPINHHENTTITGYIVEPPASHDDEEITDNKYIDWKFNDSKDEPLSSHRISNEVFDQNNLKPNNNDETFEDELFTKYSSVTMSQIRAYLDAYKMAYQNNEDNRNELKNALLDVVFGANYKYRDHQTRDPINEYKQRWGIPSMLGLCGGGESSLNSGGGANWGPAPATTPNNNNNANQSGWGGTPGNPPGSAGPPSNWGGNNVNRPVTGNPNSNQNQGPPGTQNNPGNVNKVNNPNQPGNPQAGQPTSQSSNPTQGNQNSAGQWSQGKPNNPVGPGAPNPTAQNNNGTNAQQQPSGSNANNNQANNPAQGTVATTGTAAATNPSTKAQLEQLNIMREALFSQDGWSCQQVNQDTNWDVPASPEPPMTKDGVPMWKPPVNNGTDLWEANLRNGGQPPPPQQAKTPWGHTPSTNIGGTWGEDDDAADTSNMWTGAPAPSQPNAAPWPGAAGNQAKGCSSWGDPRIDPRDPRDLRSVDPREMRDPRDHRMTLDPRDQMRVMDTMVGRDHRMTDMRGDPRGISGRLNGANADAMWGQPPGPPHHQLSHQHPSGGPPAKMINQSSMNQWAAPPPKEMIPGKPSGWEEPSPPTQRRNVPNYDDGTSLWGNPAANQRPMPGSKVSHWKDLPTPNLARGGMQCPPGMPQNRMPGQPGMKPDVGGSGGGGGGGGATGGGGGGGAGGPMWGHPGGPGGRNGSWADGPHEATTWDEPKTPAAWNEPPLNQAAWGGPSGHKSKPMGGPGAASWADTDMDRGPSWTHPAKPALTKELIWNSREFRYLCDLGYKKEDVEVALRTREMNRDEAQELLSQLHSLDQWRRHDAPSGYDPSSQPSSSAAYPRFNHVAQQMSFPPGAGVPSGAATGNVSGSVASPSLLKLQLQQQQQAAVQLQQQQPSANPPQPPFNQASRTLQNPPSTQQLRMLVQQIQLAVQEGYLNQQILNQPLAPPTLLLLNQLLQQIKVLQQLHQQHSMQNPLKGNGEIILRISVQITKTKQQIANLQNQIAVQQATYMKQQQQQQQQQQQHQTGPSQASDYYKSSSVHDPMSALQNSFSDLAMNKEPPVSQQQSRLNQWKLPSLDKDGDLSANEFSRAPGTTSKPPQTPVGLSHSHSSPNMNPLLGQGDGTWSSRLGDSGWPDAGNNDATDGKDWQPGGTAFTDLVPEFEPGKPWKMKNIEDDPSITPGSVVRSLSLAAIKDPDAIFSSSSKSSPPPQSVNADTSIPSLSNSTWSFNPPATTQSAFASSKNTWTDPTPPTYSELWGVPMRVRGPPPGLGSKGAGWPSGTWLLLKNLTPQIDGSTLKTLCMQHGPVLDFRLFLNHGIALTKYSTRDEATKAQGALNNCVLGNTTIFAESPVDNEAHTLLHTLSHGGGGQQQSSNSGNTGWGMRPTKKAGPSPDTWSGSSSQLWGAPPSSNSLWSNSGIDTSDTQRTTPSSLNLYLPGDLLGGESM